MITFRIAYIGDANDDKLFQQAQQYFEEKNLEDEEFQIVFEDITDMPEGEIISKTYHAISFDETILETDKKDILKKLMDQRAEKDDIQMFSASKKVVTQNDVDYIKKEIKKILGTEENVVLANISDEKDIIGYLDSISISSDRYRELSGDVLEQRKELRNITKHKVLEAIKRKDEIDGKKYVTYDHVKQVAKSAKAFVEFLGWNNYEIENVEFIGYVHDVGKIIIPHNVVNAPRLTISNEVQQMEPHDELGNSILSSKLVDSFEEQGIIGHHRKRLEKGITTEESYGKNIYADLITLVDSSDAMTSQRAYNNPKNIIEFLEQLEICSRVPRDGVIQFQNRKLTEQFIMFNIIELGKIGYDVRAMIEFTLNSKNNDLSRALESGDEFRINKARGNIETSEKLLEIIDREKEKVEINQNPEKDAVTALGYRLTEEGYLEYVDKTLQHDFNIRVNSEFEFKIKKFFENKYPNKLKESQDINELIDIYVEEVGLPKEETELWKEAEKRIKQQDELGKKIVNSGKSRIIEEEGSEKKSGLDSQIEIAAQNDEGYTTKQIQDGYSKLIEMTKDKEEVIEEKRRKERRIIMKINPPKFLVD